MFAVVPLMLPLLAAHAELGGWRTHYSSWYFISSVSGKIWKEEKGMLSSCRVTRAPDDIQSLWIYIAALGAEFASL